MSEKLKTITWRGYLGQADAEGLMMEAMTEKDRQVAAKVAARLTAVKHTCPHGHRFGRDCDILDECDNCPIWDACMKANRV